MSVKAFCAQQSAWHFLFLNRPKQRPITSFLYLILITFLLLGLLPNAAQAAPEAVARLAMPSAAARTVPRAPANAPALLNGLPVSGAPVPQLAVFDDTMQQFMRERSIKAGTLAISRNGVVIFNRGYGWKDSTLQTPLQPDTLLRLASIDKILTAAAIKRLFAQGQLSATTKVFELLNITPPPGQTPDPRLNDITVQHLLDHQGGWDPQEAQFDPMFEVIHIAEALGIPSPAEAADIARYMAGQPLQFAPGARTAYSNFGYSLLKSIVEQVAGQTLVGYLQTEFGLDIDRSFSLPQDRNSREIWYSDPNTCPNVFDPSSVLDPAKWVPCADGGFNAGSHALTATSATLADFLTRFWISGDPRSPGENGYIYVFFGSVPGTFTAIYQRPDGVNLAALFNQRTDPSGLNYEDIIQLFDTATDSVTEWPTAGVCDPIASDEASLASAIRCINTAGPGTHTITLTNNISFTQPSPVLTNPAATEIVIEGNGYTLDANGHGRVLTVKLTHVLIRNLTLRGGRLPLDGTRDDSGGGIQLAASFRDGGCGLTLLDSIVEDNEAPNGGGIANLCDSSKITITNSLIRNNHAVLGGGIYIPTAEELFSELVMTNSQVTHNRAEEQGGGIFLRAGDAGTNATISASTIASNVVVNGAGGGISVRTGNEAAGTNLTLRNVAITDNMASAGGGLHVESRGSTVVTVGNTTISSNRASSGNGGGVFIKGATEFDSTNVRLINSTVANNTATEGGGIYKLDGLLTLANTLVVMNTTGSDCTLAVSPGLPSRYVSAGHNLDSDGTCLPADVRQPSDIPNGNANLGPLADNGGPTLTHALLSDSQAIDAGDDAVCAAAPVNAIDQRGVARPQSAHCDIGAVEVQIDQGATFTVTKFTDSNDGVCDSDCSLREAIAAANLRPSPDQIQLDSGTYLLTIPTLRDAENDSVDEDGNAIGDLDIADDLVLVGKGAAATIIDGNQGDRVLEVLSTAKVTVEDLTIRNGLMSEMGGGLSNSGTLLLNRVHVVDNRAASAFRIGHGGGLFNDGTLTVTNSLLANNHAAGGEASYGEGGAIRNDGVMTMTQSTIQNNRVSDDNDYGIGGGIVNQGALHIERSTLTDNHTVRGPGGAIANRLGGRLKVINSTISANGSGSGGGIANGNEFDDPGAVMLIHTTIANNIGGGLYNRGVTTATNTIIAGNLLDVDEKTTAQNCFSAGTFTSLGATLLGNVGNCPSDGPGDITIDNTTVFTALLGPLADNGGPTLTHALLAGSVAIDSANAANCAMAAVGGVDQRGVLRPQGPACDIGAYEAAAPAANNLFFVSSRSSGRAGDVAFRDEDILAYDASNSSWAMIFDGSDVGITKDVNAFHVQADGSLLLSFNGPTTVPGLGAVDDSDIVRFIPTALGSQTVGSFAWYLRGADVGLSTDSEDIDAIGFTDDAHLVVSTIGDFNTPNVAGKDEDLIQLNNATFGNPSSGAWSLFLDGSTVGLANEDINGLWIDPVNNELYLTVKDQFAFAQQDIDANDIFVCTLSPAGACSYAFFWDADQHDYGADNLDSIGLGLLSPVLSATVQKSAVETGSDADVWMDEESDDLEVEEEPSLHVFLPIITQAALDD